MIEKISPVSQDIDKRGKTMELGRQIKRYRGDNDFSQEELAEKVYVSRQTVSNWENDKCYPDIKSLLLLSECFGVSLDQLVKGDIREMKEKINVTELEDFQRESMIFAILLIVGAISPIPLVHFLWITGIVIWVVIVTVMMYYAIKIERHKKSLDIQTYKEILAFTEGRNLSEIEKAREYGKRPYQEILLGIASGIITLIISIIMIFFLEVL